MVDIGYYYSVGAIKTGGYCFIYHFRVFAAGMEKSWKPCLQTAVGCLLVLRNARTASDVFFYWTMLAGQYARRVESVLSVSFWGALMKDRKYSP